MEKARFYETMGVPVPELAGSTSEWFRWQGFDTYVFTDNLGRIFVEAHQQNFVRSIFGLSAALNVVFTPQPENRVLVELGGAMWGDKIAAGAVGLLFLHPLLLTAAFGAWNQSQLDGKVYGHINNYLYTRTGRQPLFQPAAPYYPYADYPGTPAYYNYPPTTPPAGYGYGYYSQGYAPQGQQPPVPYNWPPQPATPPRRASWFDEQGMQPAFADSVNRAATWQAAIADGVINQAEIEAQEKLVAELQSKAEDTLSTDQKIKLAEILSEMNTLEKIAA